MGSLVRRGGRPPVPPSQPFPCVYYRGGLGAATALVNLPPAAAGLASGHTLFLERAARPGAESRATPTHRAVAPPGLRPAPPEEPKSRWEKKEGFIFVTCVLVRVCIYVIFFNAHTPLIKRGEAKQNRKSPTLL